MKSVITIILVALAIHTLLVMYDNNKLSNQYKNYLLDLGINAANKMSFDELQASYVYLNNYNKTPLTKEDNPVLYNKIQAINSKYSLFNLA